MVIVYHYRSHWSSTRRESLFEMLTKNTTASSSSSSLHQRAATGPPSEPQPPASPGFPTQSPLRRTTRKRSAPLFCVCHPGQQPPPPTGRGRGRPPKARPMCPCQGIDTGNGNMVSPKPSSGHSITAELKSLREDNQLGKQSSQCEQSPTHHRRAGPTRDGMEGTDDISIRCVEETNSEKSDVSLLNSPGPVGGGKSVRNVCLDDQTSPDVSSKILPNVDNTLHCMAGIQTSEDQTRSNSRSYGINKDFSSTLKSIYSKHGDITQNCWLKSDSVKSCVLSGICEVVQDLRNKQVKDLAGSSLDSYYAPVMDAENMNMNVLWLRKRLDELKDAVRLFERKGLEEEKHRLLEVIDEQKKVASRIDNEMARLKSKRQVTTDQVTQGEVMVEELNKKINARTSTSKSEYREFSHVYAMDGLV